MKKKNLRALSIAAFVALSSVATSSPELARADNCHEMAIYTTAKNAGFKTLTAAIDAAGLQEVLTKDGPFTVFAPTDEAFAKLPEGTIESLLNDKEALKAILLYHVVSGEVTSGEVVKLSSATTLSGEEIKIRSYGGVKVNDAKVIQADVKSSNGVIHVIDTVLIPSGAEG